MIWHKYNGLIRYILAHTSTNFFPLYVVNEYPKAGGSWVAEMLSDALNIPFPRNRLPTLNSSILHGHMMHSWNMHNVLIVWRDGRDILVSQYFHYLFKNERGNSRLVEKSRADLQFFDYEDISKNIIPFMEYIYENKKHPRMTWAEFVKKWVNCKHCVHVRYEDLRMEPINELQRIINQLAGISLDDETASKIVDKFSFEKMSGRKTGKSDNKSFLRKGIVGDWKTHFNKETKRRFQAYAGDALIRLNYESDHSWINK